MGFRCGQYRITGWRHLADWSTAKHPWNDNVWTHCLFKKPASDWLLLSAKYFAAVQKLNVLYGEDVRHGMVYFGHVADNKGIFLNATAAHWMFQRENLGRCKNHTLVFFWDSTSPHHLVVHESFHVNLKLNIWTGEPFHFGSICVLYLFV